MRTKSVPRKKNTKTYRIEISNRLLTKLVAKRAAMESSQATQELDVGSVYEDSLNVIENWEESGDANLEDSQRFFSQEDVHILPNLCDNRISKTDRKRNNQFWNDPITRRTGNLVPHLICQNQFST